MSRRNKAGEKKSTTVKIKSRVIPVRMDPSRTSAIVCQLRESLIVQYSNTVIIEEIEWVNINSGWICSRDSNGIPSYETVPAAEGHKFWAKEHDNRRRVSSAVSSMLTKSLSLTEARRFSKALAALGSSFVEDCKPLIGLPDVALDDILIAISSAVGLRQHEVFEFIKIVATQQSSPPKALSDMCDDINSMLTLRPSLWVKNKLGILTTVDLKNRNDNFIMTAARGDIKNLEGFLNAGQELACLHSELHYTALHAASDFGSGNAVVKLLATGVSPNIRDARYGQTALHFAAQSGRSSIVELLIAKGADRTIANYKGTLAFEIADEQGHYECREILKFPPPEIQHAAVSILWFLLSSYHVLMFVSYTCNALDYKLHLNFHIARVDNSNNKRPLPF